MVVDVHISLEFCTLNETISARLSSPRDKRFLDVYSRSMTSGFPNQKRPKGLRRKETLLPGSSPDYCALTCQRAKSNMAENFRLLPVNEEAIRGKTVVQTVS